MIMEMYTGTVSPETGPVPDKQPVPLDGMHHSDGEIFEVGFGNEGQSQILHCESGHQCTPQTVRTNHRFDTVGADRSTL